MSLSININSDLKKLTNEIDKVQKKQIPFATAQALNQTAFDATEDLKRLSTRLIDRPTPFTLKGFRYQKTNKIKLSALVYIGDVQSGYLKYLIEGGTRLPKNKYIVVPHGNTKLNKFGNFPKNKIKNLLAQAGTFSGTPKGFGAGEGVWKRTKSKIKKIASYRRSVEYNGGQLPFEKIVKRTVSKKFENNFEQAFKRAMDSSS